MTENDEIYYFLEMKYDEHYDTYKLRFYSKININDTPVFEGFFSNKLTATMVKESEARSLMFQCINKTKNDPHVIYAFATEKSDWDLFFHSLKKNLQARIEYFYKTDKNNINVF